MPKVSSDDCLCGKEFDSLRMLSDHISGYDDRRLHGPAPHPIITRSRKKVKVLRKLPFPRWATKRLPRRGRFKRFMCLYRCPIVAVASDMKRGTLRILWRYPCKGPPEEIEEVGGDREYGIVYGKTGGK